MFPETLTIDALNFANAASTEMLPRRWGWPGRLPKRGRMPQMGSPHGQMERRLVSDPWSGLLARLLAPLSFLHHFCSGPVIIVVAQVGPVSTTTPVGFESTST